MEVQEEDGEEEEGLNQSINQLMKACTLNDYFTLPYISYEKNVIANPNTAHSVIIDFDRSLLHQCNVSINFE